jgi:hypothetical protein
MFCCSFSSQLCMKSTGQPAVSIFFRKRLTSSIPSSFQRREVLWILLWTTWCVELANLFSLLFLQWAITVLWQLGYIFLVM